MPLSNKKKKEKLTQLDIDADKFLDELTDLELETSSRVIFTLCESVRDVDLYKNEPELLRSFIEWGTKETKRLNQNIQELENNEEINPNQGEMFPEKEGPNE